MDLSPRVLEGRTVRLVPLEPQHAAPLWRATLDTEVWPWMPFRIASEEELGRFIAGARALNAAGSALGFAIVHRAADAPIGVTGFWNADHAHRRVEIGATWVTRAHQRSAVNTEAKLLLLREAFDALDCVRVEFKTDARNARSRAALARIGAVEEGTLRQHMVLPDGHLRDSVYFSVISGEWPGVRERLQRLLERG